MIGIELKKKSAGLSLRIFFILFLLTPGAQAFDSFPEFQHSSEEELIEVNGPQHVGSEYQSDVLAFSKPVRWNRDWFVNDKVFDLTVGSFNGTRFGTDNRLKIRANLVDSVQFRFSYIDQANFDQVNRNMMVEFVFRLNHWLSWSVYGEPSTRKSEDDMGTAAIVNLTDSHSLRAFVTFVDFTLNKRNEADDRYERKPMSYGIVGRWVPKDKEGQFFEYAMRWDTPQTRNFPSQGKRHSFARRYFGIQARLPVRREGTFMNFQLSGGDRHEGQVETSPPPNTVAYWDQKNIEALLQFERNDHIVGLKSVYRQWNSDLGAVIHNDLLPHVWIAFPKKGSHPFWRRWKAGYEFTWHRGRGDESLRSDLDKNDVLEHRLNLRYDLIFNDQANLYILLSADLDDFGTGRTWEGGNVQFQWFF